MGKMNLFQILDALKAHIINYMQYQNLLKARLKAFHKPNFTHSRD